MYSLDCLFSACEMKTTCVHVHILQKFSETQFLRYLIWQNISIYDDVIKAMKTKYSMIESSK